MRTDRQRDGTSMPLRSTLSSMRMKRGHSTFHVARLRKWPKLILWQFVDKFLEQDGHVQSEQRRWSHPLMYALKGCGSGGATIWWLRKSHERWTKNRLARAGPKDNHNLRDGFGDVAAVETSSGRRAL